MKKDSENIRDMFNDIAPKYDFLNHLLSMGVDKGWRKKVVKRVTNDKPAKLLDLATGTCDLAIAIAKKNPNCKITGGDLSPKMLEVGRKKCEAKGLDKQIELRECSALDLPFEDNSFDVITVAFGVRNFEDLKRGLSEMLRVVKKGGNIYILEFSKPKSTIISAPYLFYFKNILPMIGKAVSKSANAYTYLPDSVISFPCGEEFTEIMKEVGFSSYGFKPLSFGIATIYYGKK